MKAYTGSVSVDELDCVPIKLYLWTLEYDFHKSLNIIFLLFFFSHLKVQKFLAYCLHDGRLRATLSDRPSFADPLS